MQINPNHYRRLKLMNGMPCAEINIRHYRYESEVHQISTFENWWRDIKHACDSATFLEDYIFSYYANKHGLHIFFTIFKR